MKIATWNIGSALNMDREVAINSMVRCLEKYDLDVLCLQEIITSGADISYVDELKNRLGFLYAKQYELSSAHLDDASINMGVAILSKHKITTEVKIPLDNPGLRVYKNNKWINSDNKGFLFVKLSYKSDTISIVTGHMLPYHSFDDDSINHIADYQKMYNLVKSYCGETPYVLCGDLNTSKIDRVLPEICLEMQSAFSSETRQNGNQNDYIFVSKSFTYSKERVEIVKGYDHYLCVCNIELASKNSIRILHLSDIHFGSENNDIDIKTNLVGVSKNDTNINIFSNRIRDNAAGVDYVIVSGDITNGGNENGYEKFGKMVKELQNSKSLPDSKHFIIVPGNHDVGDGDKGRWEEFIRVLKGKFIRPWLQQYDERIDVLSAKLEDFLSGDYSRKAIIYGRIKLNDEEINIPLLLDRNNKVLIYAFNSSIISKSKIQLNEQDDKVVETVRKYKRASKQTVELLKILDKELLVDPARIDPKELLLFSKLMNVICKHENMAIYHKIAVLHHPVSSYATPEEIKKFNDITNAGYFKKVLADNGFQIIMHGHKHFPGVFHDSSLEGRNKFVVVAGGTVFGWTPKSRESKGFYVHSICDNCLKSNYVSLYSTNINSEVHKLNGDESFSNGLTLHFIRERIKEKVLHHINYEVDSNGNVRVGWSKLIHDANVGSIATVYGLLILEKLDCKDRFYLAVKNDIIETLWRFRTDNGGWGAVSQINNMGAPEATCWVVLAFYYAGSKYLEQAIDDLCEIYERMKEQLNSVFTISLIILTLVKVKPNSPIINECYKTLFSSAVKKDRRIKCWKNMFRNVTGSTNPESIVSTAIAIKAIYECRNIGICEHNLEEELVDTLTLLMDTDKWGNYHEPITIIEGDRHDCLKVDYYTVAWVAKALMCMDNYVDFSIIQKAIDKILNDFDNGYWDYGGSNYIWTMYDAYTALELFNLYK